MLRMYEYSIVRTRPRLFPRLARLIETVLGSQDSRHLHSDNWQRTIYIDTLGVGTTDFDLSDSKKKALVESGKTNTKKYFEWYDDVRNKPVNRS